MRFVLLKVKIHATGANITCAKFPPESLTFALIRPLLFKKWGRAILFLWFCYCYNLCLRNTIVGMDLCDWNLRLQDAIVSDCAGRAYAALIIRTLLCSSVPGSLCARVLHEETDGFLLLPCRAFLPLLLRNVFLGRVIYSIARNHAPCKRRVRKCVSTNKRNFHARE